MASLPASPPVLTCRLLGSASDLPLLLRSPAWATTVRVPCGFPSSADDYVERAVDLQRLLVSNAQATYLLRAEGRSMESAGIHENDLLVVDCSAEARDGRVVVAAVDGGLTVKRVRGPKGRQWLEGDGPRGPERVVGGEAWVWGVVRYVIHVPE